MHFIIYIMFLVLNFVGNILPVLFVLLCLYCEMLMVQMKQKKITLIHREPTLDIGTKFTGGVGWVGGKETERGRGGKRLDPHPAREFRTFPHGTGDETIVSPRIFGCFTPFFRENIQGGLLVVNI